MKNITEIVQRYVSGWNEPTHEAVKAAFKECCINDVTYKDKKTPILYGIDALVDLVMESYQLFPGRTFSILIQPEYFDGSCHYSWGAHVPATGHVAGWDYLEYNDDNQITAIVGFLPA